MTENKMQAIRLTQPCAAADLKPTQVDVPQLKPGYALVKVRAFGVNDSEVTSRKGESSPDFQFPRILGIEGVGVIDQVNANSSFKPGQQVATMMGGMGRAIDGSYAEYMLVKEENLIPFESDLDWSILGALPEMLQTAYGSISQGLHVQSGDLFLVRGGWPDGIRFGSPYGRQGDCHHEKRGQADHDEGVGDRLPGLRRSGFRVPGAENRSEQGR